VATQEQRLRDLTTQVATELKKTRALVNANQSDLAALTTADKTNLVAAINSLVVVVNGQAGAAKIDDTSTTSQTTTYSAKQINQKIADAIAQLEGGASTALDTLAELAAAIGNDANFANTVTVALGNRVRVDVAQGLTTGQKAQARSNIDAYGSVELGNPDVDLAAVFTAGLA
jgi:hypothetical protein